MREDRAYHVTAVVSVKSTGQCGNGSNKLQRQYVIYPPASCGERRALVGRFNQLMIVGTEPQTEFENALGYAGVIDSIAGIVLYRGKTK